MALMEYVIKPILDPQEFKKKLQDSFKDVKKSTDTLKPRIEKLKDSFKKGFDNTFVNKSGKGIDNFKKKVIGIGVALGGLATIKKGISIASDFEQETGKLDYALGEQSSKLKDFIKTMNNDLKLGEVELTKKISDIAVKMKNIGFDGTNLLENTQNITKAMYDMAGSTGKSLEEVQSAIEDAMGGRLMGLQRMGIMIDSSEIERVAKQLGIAKDSMTDLQKAQITTNLLMQKMDAKGMKGGINDALKTFDWAMLQLKGQTTDLFKNVFTPLMLEMTPLITQFATFISSNKEGVEAFAKGLAKTFAVLGKAIGGVSKLIKNIFKSIDVEKLINVLSSVFKTMGKSIELTFTILSRALSKINFDNIGKGFSKILDSVNVDGIFLMFENLFKFLKENSGGLVKAFSFLKDVFVDMLPIFKVIFKAVGGIVAILWKVGNVVLESVMPVISTLFETLKGIGSFLFTTLKPVFGEIFQVVSSIASIFFKIGTYLWEVIKPIFIDIGNFLSTVFEPIFEVILSQVKMFADIIKGVFQGVNWVLDKIKGDKNSNMPKVEIPKIDIPKMPVTEIKKETDTIKQITEEINFKNTENIKNVLNEKNITNTDMIKNSDGTISNMVGANLGTTNTTNTTDNTSKTVNNNTNITVNAINPDRKLATKLNDVVNNHNAEQERMLGVAL